MSTTDHLGVVAEFYRRWDERPVDAARIGEMISADYVDHHRPEAPPEATDRDVIVGLAVELATGFPDGRHEIFVQEPVGDDRVLVYWTFTGTQTGTLFGAPATGAAVTMDGTDLIRVRGGLIVEQWHIEQLQRMFGQIAAVAS